MKKILLTVVALMMVFVLLTACASPEAEPPVSEEPVVQEPAQEPTEPPVASEPVTVATLAGPTGMGLTQLFDNPSYDVSLLTSPDQITPKVISGETDVATIPSNLAAVLYNKMQGGISIVSVNTMGVLYILENGDTVTDIKDLAGKTIYATGQGSTPEYALDKILTENGVENVEVEYMGAHADLANALATGEVKLALLPEPFVSTVLAKNADLAVKIDINEEWVSIFGADAGMPMGVTIVSSAFAQDKAAMERLIADYSASVEYVTTDLDSAAAAIAGNQIVGSADIAKAAIPRCGISFITGEQCKAILKDYFEVMFASNPESLGGAIPGDDIFYMP